MPFACAVLVCVLGACSGSNSGAELTATPAAVSGTTTTSDTGPASDAAARSDTGAPPAVRYAP